MAEDKPFAASVRRVTENLAAREAKKAEQKAVVDRAAERAKKPHTRIVPWQEILTKFSKVDSTRRWAPAQSEKAWNEFGRSAEVQQRQQENLAKEEAMAPRLAQLDEEEYQYKAQRRQETDWQQKVNEFSNDLRAVGQGDLETFNNASNVAEMAQAMMLTEGDDAADMRQNAAYILSTYRDQLEPHLGEWYSANEELIKDNTPEPGRMEKLLSSNYMGVSATDVLKSLGEFQRSMSGVMGGLSYVAQPGDGVSRTEGGVQAAGQFLRGLDATRLIPNFDGVSQYIPNIEDDARYINNFDGQKIDLDINEDGAISMREALFHDPARTFGVLGNTSFAQLDPTHLLDSLSRSGVDLPDFLEKDRQLDVGGIADLGTEIITDPLTYVGLGPSRRAAQATSALSRSPDNLVATAGRMMGTDRIPLSQMDPVLQQAARSGLRSLVMEEVTRLTPQQLARAAARQNLKPSVWVRNLRREADEARSLLDNLVDNKVASYEYALQNGNKMGLRVGDTNLIPMDKVLRATRLAGVGNWRQRGGTWAQLATPNEFMEFVLTSPKNAVITPEMAAKIRSTSDIFTQLADPELHRNVLINLLDTSPNPMVAYQDLKLFLGTLGIKTNHWDDWARYVPERGYDGVIKATDDFVVREAVWVNRETGEEIPDSIVRAEGTTQVDMEAKGFQFRPETRAQQGSLSYGETAPGRVGGYQGWLMEPGRMGESYEGIPDGFQTVPARYRHLDTGQEYIAADLPRTSSLTPENAEARGYLYIPKSRVEKVLEEAKFRNLETGQEVLQSRLPKTSTMTPENAEARGFEFIPAETEDAIKWREGDRLGPEREQMTLEGADPGFRIRENARKLTPEERARVMQNMDMFAAPEEWVRDVVRASPITALRDSEKVLPRWLGSRITRFSDRFSPRANIRRDRNMYRGAADDLDSAMADAQALADWHHDDLARIGWDSSKGESALEKASMKETIPEFTLPDGRVLSWTKPQEAVSRTLAMDAKDRALVAQHYIDNGAENTGVLIQSLDSMRNDTFALNVAAEADYNALVNHPNYMPRVRTQYIVDQLANAQATGNKAKLKALEAIGVDTSDEIGGTYVSKGIERDLTQDGHLRGRSAFREIEDLYEINEKARKIWEDAGLDPTDFKLYEDDAVMVYMLRSKAAHQGHASVKMLKGMELLKDNQGRQFVYMARGGKTPEETAQNVARMKLKMESERQGQKYVTKQLPNGGVAWIHDTIWKDLDNTNRVLRDPKTAEGVAQFMDEWNGVWGKYATSPLFGFAFHARNATGNAYNMWLGGVRNPVRFAEAADIQAKIGMIERTMKRDSVAFDTALKAAGLNKFDEAVIRGLRTRNLYRQGGKMADLSRASRGAVDELAPTKGTIKGRLFHDNFILNTGQEFGSAIEDNAKIAMFIDGLKKGMSEQDAARNVRVHLFDYTDLTTFEQETVRMINRFYTFIRKNTALQMHVAATQPGNIVNANKIVEAFTEWVMGGPGEESDAEGSGYYGAGRFLPPWFRGVLDVYQGGDFAAGMETPFTTALETGNSISAFVSIPAAAMDIYSTDDEEDRKDSWYDLKQRVRQALQLTSGGPVEGIKTIAELATEIDMYTGASLSNKDETWRDMLFRLTDTVAPIGGKADAFYEDIGNLADGGHDQRLILANLFMGLSTLDMTDPEKAQENLEAMLSSAKYAMYEARDDYTEATGEEVMTIEDLEKAGKIDYRNRVWDTMIQASFDPEWDWNNLTKKQWDSLTVGMPDDFLELVLGLEAPVDPNNKTVEEASTHNRTMLEMLTLAESYGIEVTDDMKEQYLMLTLDGLSVQGVKDLGIEPVYLRDKFQDGQDPDKPDTYYADRAIAAFEAAGIDVSDLQRRRPLLTKAERELSQMARAGYTEEEIKTYLIEDMARKKAAFFFGADGLPVWQVDRFDKEEQEAMQERAWELEGEFNAIYTMFFGGKAPEGTLDQYIAHNVLTNDEEKAFGFTPITVPGLKDGRTQEQKNEDSGNKWYAAQQGLTRLGAGQ